MSLGQQQGYDYKEILEDAGKVCRLSTQVFQDDPKKRLPFMNTYLEIQSSMQEYTGALETLTELVKIYRSGESISDQSSDPVLAKYLYALSSVHGKLGNDEQCIATFYESRKIVQNCKSKDDALVATL